MARVALNSRSRRNGGAKEISKGAAPDPSDANIAEHAGDSRQRFAVARSTTAATPTAREATPQTPQPRSRSSERRRRKCLRVRSPSAHKRLCVCS